MTGHKFALLSIAVLLMSYGCRTEDKLEPTKVDTYIKLIGDPEYPLVAVDARKDDQGDLILLANLEKEEDGEFDFAPMIVKIDHNGNYIGSRDGFTSLFDDEKSFISHSLTIENLTSYLIVGEVINGTSSEIALVTYSTSSGFKGPYTINDGNSIAEEGIGKAVQVNSGSYFIVAESLETPGLNKTFQVDLSAFGTGNMMLIPDNEENFVNAKSTIINRIFKAGQGRMVWAGPVDQNTKAQVSVMLPPEGNIQVGESFPSNAETLNTTAFYSPQFGKYMIAGTIPDGDETSINVYSYSSTGIPKVLTDPTVIGRTGNELPVSITPSDGGFAILATTEQGNGEEDFVLINLVENADGLELDFMKSFGGENADFAKTVLWDSDGGFIMFGHTEFSDVNTLLLIKCDANGEL